MMNNDFIDILVSLYRLAGRPTLPSRPLEMELHFGYSEEALLLLNKLLSNARHSKYVTELEVDDEDSDIAPLENSWSTVYLSIILPNDGISRFHDNIQQLISYSSLSEGSFPESFYIIDLNYYSKDLEAPSCIINLKKICKLICALSNLAHYHDKKSSSNESRLVFIQNIDGKSSTAILIPQITEDLLSYSEIDYQLVEKLISDESQSDIIHIDERRGIFRNTLVEFINDNNHNFSSIIKEWPILRSQYDSNLSVYLSGFHFHKARKDVASAELEFSEKVSKNLSELTSKILAIPVSVIASLGMWKLEKFSEQSLVFIGLVLTSFMLHISIQSQSKQLKRIVHARKIVFSPFEKKLNHYPNELREEIKFALDQLKKNEVFTSDILSTFYFLSWLPVIIGIVIFYLKS
ncbi:hypothetical protein [Pantoea dispersa]|uniref:hypothetical protein n=1 Tax=Pantoea dispersa TaxID=59814 RepID=UPI000FDB396D|nr:hypothetical protein [Pantoea dispersa]MDR6298254.1 hypothetical protein [Pantoea dispersa]RVU75166.1 hypothetical protein EKH82_11795 [Pantoea dispersa]